MAESAKKSTGPVIMYSKQDCVVRWDGGNTILRKDQTIEEDHPLVAQYPNLFTYDVPRASLHGTSGPVVERGTRAPGEVRRTPGTGPEQRG